MLDPGREEEVLSRVAEMSRGPLSSQALRNTFRELISGSRALERAMRVAYLGPAYTYSHLAAIHRFGQSVDLVPVGGIPAVFEEVNRGQTQFGIVPLENSTDGRIADTLDMFTRLPVRICGEVQLRIHHHLLGHARVERCKKSTAGRRHYRNVVIGCQSIYRRQGRSKSPAPRPRRSFARQARRRSHCQHSSGSALRTQCVGREHRGRTGQPHPIRRHWRPSRQSNGE